MLTILTLITEWTQGSSLDSVVDVKRPNIGIVTEFNTEL